MLIRDLSVVCILSVVSPFTAINFIKRIENYRDHSPHLGTARSARSSRPIYIQVWFGGPKGVDLLLFLRLVRYSVTLLAHKIPTLNDKIPDPYYIVRAITFNEYLSAKDSSDVKLI